MKPYRAVVLDIEGTTTPISFVYERLFPFAREGVRKYLEGAWHQPEAQQAAQALRAQAILDVEAGIVGASLIPTGPPEVEIDALVANVEWQMDADRKTTGLKLLQGQIWVSGYEDGALQGQLFADIVPSLDRWREAGRSLHVYSSGSVAAQKLLFAYSEAGDLTPYFASYFDTNMGGKREAASYAGIAQAIGVPGSEILFLSDRIEELDAAAEAGWQVALSIRPGNAPISEHGYEAYTDFREIPLL